MRQLKKIIMWKIQPQNHLSNFFNYEKVLTVILGITIMQK